MITFAKGFLEAELVGKHPKVTSFRVERCARSSINKFIETHHYSKSINGCIADYSFRLLNQSTMIGAMFYGRMAMHNQWQRFADKESDVIELRRLCCIDDTPKNTESYFIGHTLRWLKKNTSKKVVVSYADLEYGHVGTIYKATNFEFLGVQPGARVIQWKGKKYHDKAIRTKYNGELKPFAWRLSRALESGEAFYTETKGKACYVMKLR